ncbi:MAG TPA: MFS transporter [Saprospiraceae bacterium]|nr:MFS transporter [Saprospiraceae bacterium]HNE64279.1 MFS transporter [Saprospiraceae bacterium]HNG06765.1 MFS transporter [Saprospiraceae bacterium]
MKKTPLFTLLLTIFIDIVGFSIIIPILPVYSKEIGASNIMVGIIAGSYSLMNFLFSPVWGNISDRIGRKPVILVSLFITACSYLLFAYSKTISLLLISRIIAGIGSANYGAAQAYISDITKPEDRARAFGYVGAAFGLGFIIGPVIGVFILKMWNVAAIGYVTMALNLANMLMAMAILHETRKEVKSGTPLLENPIINVRDGLKTPVLGKLMFISLLYITALSMMQITISVFWSEKYGLSKTQISGMFAFMGIMSVLVQGFLVGKLTLKFGEKNMMIIGAVLLAAGLYIIPMAPYKEGFYLVEGFAIILISLANGCLSPSITSLLSQNAGAEEQGKVLGVGMSVNSLGRVIGPYAGGFLYGMAMFMPYFIGTLIMIGAWNVARRFRTKYAHI